MAFDAADGRLPAWHAASDQPQTIPAGPLRSRLIRRRMADVPRILFRVAMLLPLLLPAALLAAGHWPRRRLEIGVGCDPDVGSAEAHRAALDGLGDPPLLIRVFAGRSAADLAARAAFCRAIAPGRRWTVVLVQDPQAPQRQEPWAGWLHRVRENFGGLAEAWVVGQATNRAKWGMLRGREYGGLCAVARRVLGRSRPMLVGQVLDFEPLALLNHMLDAGPADGCAWGLYADRRGHPDNRQFVVFDIRRKIALGAAVVRMLPRIRRRLWITEVNWPLRGEGEWAPAVGDCCVDEESAARFLAAYLDRAEQSGLVERVFVWQLLARGYGLVDPRDLRRRPAWETVAAARRAAAAG